MYIYYFVELCTNNIYQSCCFCYRKNTQLNHDYNNIPLINSGIFWKATETTYPLEQHKKEQNKKVINSSPSSHPKPQTHYTFLCIIRVYGKLIITGCRHHKNRCIYIINNHFTTRSEHTHIHISNHHAPIIIILRKINEFAVLEHGAKYTGDTEMGSFCW